jgi:hypothetical protein
MNRKVMLSRMRSIRVEARERDRISSCFGTPPAVAAQDEEMNLGFMTQ